MTDYSAFTFTVRADVVGVGFPMEMLRYGRCHPRHQDDTLIAEDWMSPSRGLREVELVGYRHLPDGDLRSMIGQNVKARWKSFGWSVVEGSEHAEVSWM
jgi:hypothetical protein